MGKVQLYVCVCVCLGVCAICIYMGVWCMYMCACMCEWEEGTKNISVAHPGPGCGSPPLYGLCLHPW